MNFEHLLATIIDIDQSARRTAGKSVDRLLTLRNWLVGACLVEYEQNGEDRAEYGERVIERLSEHLLAAGRRGLGVRNLKNCRQLSLAWPHLNIRQTLSAVLGEAVQQRFRQTLSAESASSDAEPSSGLSESGEADLSAPPDVLSAVPVHSPSWKTDKERQRDLLRSQVSAHELQLPSFERRALDVARLDWQDDDWLMRLFSSLSFSHLLELSRIDHPTERALYELECLRCGWTVRDLRRQRGSMLYQRIGLSKDKEAVRQLAEVGRLKQDAVALVRDPYVLEFLELSEKEAWSESELEQALIDHLQEFILELGHDFCFMGRQYRITVGGRHHRLDLLFFHRALRCLVAIDLKISPFRHEFAGQMHFYLNYLKEEITHPDEQPPVGIILCVDKDEAEVHYATAGLEQSVFVSRYLVKLPSEAQLRKWLEDERELLERVPTTQV